MDTVGMPERKSECLGGEWKICKAVIEIEWTPTVHVLRDCRQGVEDTTRTSEYVPGSGPVCLSSANQLSVEFRGVVHIDALVWQLARDPVV